VIQLTDVSKVFRASSGDVTALADVDLTVPEGEIVGVIGPSGAGKSTLLRVTNLLERPSTGTVEVDGVELTALSKAGLRSARRRIGMIFQQFNLISSRTVLENIALPLEIAGVERRRRTQRAAELLPLVGLEDKAHAYPSQLSGGQQQRVGIARALAADQTVLLCDEATSALDTETTASILELLADLNRRLDLTILLITHELDVVKRICDRAVVLRDGRIAEQGRVADLVAAPGSLLARELAPALPTGDVAQLRRDPASTVVDLRFAAERAKESVVADLARRFDLDVSIIAGGVDVIAGVQLGRLLLELPPSADGEVLAHLDALGLQPEVVA
jgi:D-methionine transport system ATP-binding protein